MAISVYLTIVHYSPGALVCPNTGIISCETVLGSIYSTVLGVPIAVGGIIWFLANALMVGRKPGIFRNIWMLFGAGGFIYSVTAMHEIGKICIYCSTLDVFIVATIALFVLRRD
ncbi:MAG: hypothetical protein KGH58_00285 [Candidatus Micrarchaeota archaeon]|nr:hypothetical protein [Candidatus Micrarchaeota archaeon]